jgi:hypothetical protein
MGHWNYRVMRHSHQGQDQKEEHFFVLHQVYYTDDGEVEYWTSHTGPEAIQSGEEERGDYPFGETEVELQNDVRMMLKAFDLPVLDYATGKEIDG